MAPPKDKCQKTYWISTKEVWQLNKLAKEEGKTQTALVREALQLLFEHRGEKNNVTPE